jgi:hypothetical protein
VFRFYLGTHEARWLEFSRVPLFISHHRLTELNTYPRADVRTGTDADYRRHIESLFLTKEVLYLELQTLTVGINSPVSAPPVHRGR